MADFVVAAFNIGTHLALSKLPSHSLENDIEDIFLVANGNCNQSIDWTVPLIARHLTYNTIKDCC